MVAPAILDGPAHGLEQFTEAFQGSLPFLVRRVGFPFNKLVSFSAVDGLNVR